jgi:hypothetical protein
MSLLSFDFGVGFNDFSIKSFDNFGADFEQALEFDFGAGFEAGFSDFKGFVTVLFDDVLSIDDLTGDGSRPCRRRHVWHPNRVMRIENMTKSAWYRFFLRPGMTRELSHELSVSDQFGHFRHYFCMPLCKVKELTDLLIS